MSCQLFDPLERSDRLARIEIAAHLVGDTVGQAEASRGQGIRRSAHALAQIEVFDRANQVVDRAAPRRPGNQVEGQPAAELNGMMVIRHVGPARQGISLFKPPRSRGFLCLSQYTRRQCPNMVDSPPGLTMGIVIS